MVPFLGRQVYWRLTARQISDHVTEQASRLKRLKAEGQAILLVDKHIDALLKLADRHVVIEKGHVVWSGSSAALTADLTVRQRYLQV